MTAAVVAKIEPQASAELVSLLGTLFASYDTPFGATGETRRAKVAGYVWACEGKPITLVERVVKDFVTGKVKRSASLRSKLPTSEEFAAQLDERGSESAGVAALVSATHAPPFGPLWGARLYGLLLAGPDADMRKPSAFMAAMIAKGGEEGERYRLEHQANNGFAKVNSMLIAADEARGCMVEQRFQKLAQGVEPVPVASSVFNAWKAEHARRGWPWLPSTGKQRVAYFPKGGPIGLAAFEAQL